MSSRENRVKIIAEAYESDYAPYREQVNPRQPVWKVMGRKPEPRFIEAEGELISDISANILEISTGQR